MAKGKASSKKVSDSKPKGKSGKAGGGIIKRFFKMMLRVMLFGFIGSVLWVLIYRWVPVPFTPLMAIRFVEQIVDDKEVRFEKDWVSIDEISPSLQLAVVSSEDQLFLDHFGFDIAAIKRAMKHNKKKKKKNVRGASTISQQTAKNVFLWQGRNWVRKGLEVYFTGLIELMWSKERILEVYLNVIEMGDGIYGAEAASQTYFKRAAEKISPQQAALIAATLPNPRKYSAARPSGYILGRQQWILRQMNNIGKLDFEEEEPDEPEEEPVKKKKKSKG